NTLRNIFWSNVALGNLKIDNVSVTFCQKLANSWSREHPKRFKQYLNYAGMVFKYAETLDEIKKNPLDRIIIPVVFDDERAKKNFYSREELLDFLAAYKKVDQPKRYTLFLLLAYTGLRKGEALSLTWRDIDFKRKTITINKTLASGKNGVRLIQRPKTKASNGTISIDDTVINALKEWRAQQNNILKRFGHIASIDQLVFSQDEDNSLLYSRTPLTWLQVFYQHHPNMKKSTVHGFRHTHASLLFEAGADMKQAQDRLRHTNIKTTMNTYIHVTQEGKDETASLFDNFMANGKHVGQTLGQTKNPLE
ncbi:site-specific integrase, partial [Enterococcus thailandicus]|uniref:site-specific integrase n=1 Tax=Enterococcus thailandicus TaxID=417368 RepID=UPI0008FFE954